MPIVIVTEEEGSTGGSTVGATPGYGANGGTADQQGLIFIQEAVPGTLNSGGTAYSVTDIEGDGTSPNPIEEWVQHVPEGETGPIALAQIGIEGEIVKDWKPQYGWLRRRAKNIFGAPVSTDDTASVLTEVYRWRNRIHPSVFMESAFHGVAEDSYLLKYGAVRSISMEVARNDGPGSVSGSVGMHFNTIQRNQVWPGYTSEVQQLEKSGTVSGGYYILTVTNPDDNSSEVTGHIAHSANASTIQNALNALANVESGDIVVTGGPVNTTAVVFTFGGRFAAENIPAITVDYTNITGGGTLAVTTTTPGVASTDPTVIDTAFLEPDHFSVYMADDDTDLATINWSDTSDAHILQDCLGHQFSLDNLWNPLYMENRSRNPYGKVRAANPTRTCSITVPKDSTTCRTLDTDADGCRVEKRWLVFRAMCGTRDARFKFHVSRSGAESPGANNNLPIRTFEFVTVRNPDSDRRIEWEIIGPDTDAI